MGSSSQKVRHRSSSSLAPILGMIQMFINCSTTVLCTGTKYAPVRYRARTADYEHEWPAALLRLLRLATSMFIAIHTLHSIDCNFLP